MRGVQDSLEAVEQHAQQSLQLTRLFDPAIDRFIASEVFLARLRLARGDADAAAAMLAQTEQTARQRGFTLRLPEIAFAAEYRRLGVVLAMGLGWSWCRR